MVRLPEQCSIKVEVRLFYSHTQYWRDQCAELQRLINKLHEIYDHTSDQHRQHSYAQDKTVLDKITKLMTKHGYHADGGVGGATTAAATARQRETSMDQDAFWAQHDPEPKLQQQQKQSSAPVMRRIVGLREKGRDDAPPSKASAANYKTIKRGRSLIPREGEEAGGSFYGGQQPPAHHKPRQTATPNYTGQSFFGGGGSRAPEQSGNHEDESPGAGGINLDDTAVIDPEQQSSHHDMSVDQSRIDMSIFRQSGGRRVVNSNIKPRQSRSKSPHHHQPLGFNSSNAREFEV